MRFNNELRFEIYPIRTLRFDKLLAIYWRCEIENSPRIEKMIFDLDLRYVIKILKFDKMVPNSLRRCF